MENQYKNVKAALRWANQMEEAFPTQTNMLCRNAINSGGAQPFEEIFQVLMAIRKNHGRNEQLTEDGEMPVGIMLDRNRFNRSAVLDRLALDEAIVQLPHGYRTVFVLHDVEGLEHSEIASLLGCSIGTSKSQLHRARMRMRLLLRRRTGPR